jgi:RNA methyltransferase, TrmH family
MPQCYASAVQRIASRQNAVVAEYRDAARGEVDGTILLDGSHLIGEAIAADLRLRHVIVAADALKRPELSRLIEQLDARGVTVATAPGAVMDAVSPVRSSSPIVALAARPTPRRLVFDTAAPMVVIVCDVQDPGNVGAIVRAAEAAGAAGVVVAGQSADPFGWKALRGSMGSALRLPIVCLPTVKAAVAEARTHGAQIVATVPRHGVLLFDANLTGPTALLIGGEGLGLPADVVADADVRVTIPMEPPVESLNAAIASAILLYEARRQRTSPSAVGSEDPTLRKTGPTLRKTGPTLRKTGPTPGTTDPTLRQTGPTRRAPAHR